MALSLHVMRKILFYSIASTLTLSLLSGCGLLPEKKDKTLNWSASQLYAEAKDELDNGGFDQATKLFQTLETRYPFGTYAQQAMMDTAYAYYRQGETQQALSTIDRFIKSYPNQEHVDYMYYLRGLVNLGDNTSIFDRFVHQDRSERDPQSLKDAFDSFKLLADKFPQSQYTPDAIIKMKYIVSMLVKYEMHVANYYYRRGAYISAINRAQKVLTEYPNSVLTKDALVLMRASYDAIGDTKLSADTKRVLADNFPNAVNEMPSLKE